MEQFVVHTIAERQLGMIDEGGTNDEQTRAAGRRKQE